MQPEAVDLSKAGRASKRSFQQDSFHQYMARKIDLQRQQFGLVLPPPPPPPLPPPSLPSSVACPDEANQTKQKGSRSRQEEAQSPLSPARTVRFAQDLSSTTLDKNKKRTKQRMGSIHGTGIASILYRLQKRHGTGNKRLLRRKRNRSEISSSEGIGDLFTLNEEGDDDETDKAMEKDECDGDVVQNSDNHSVEPEKEIQHFVAKGDMASQLAADYAVPSNRAIRESMLAYDAQQSMLADDSKMEGSRITIESTPSSATTTITVTTPSPSSSKMKRIKMIGTLF